MNKNEIKIFELAFEKNIDEWREINERWIKYRNEKDFRKLKEIEERDKELRQIINSLENGAKMIIIGG